MDKEKEELKEEVSSLRAQVENLERQLYALYRRLDKNEDNDLVTDYEETLKKDYEEQ